MNKLQATEKWVGRMNACRNAAAEIVNNELIFA